MDDILKLVISQAGLSGSLVALFIIGLYTGKLVWGKQCDARCNALERQLTRMEKDRDEWKDMSLQLLPHTTRSMDVIRALVDR